MQKHLNLPTLILSSFLIRLLVLGAGIGEALVIIGLSALYGYHLLLESKKQTPVNKEIVDRIVELEEQLSITKNKVNAINLASSMKR
jgi:hypothetical protein